MKLLCLILISALGTTALADSPIKTRKAAEECRKRMPRFNQREMSDQELNLVFDTAVAAVKWRLKDAYLAAGIRIELTDIVIDADKSLWNARSEHTKNMIGKIIGHTNAGEKSIDFTAQFYLRVKATMAAGIQEARDPLGFLAAKNLICQLDYRPEQTGGLNIWNNTANAVMEPVTPSDQGAQANKAFEDSQIFMETIDLM